MTMDSTKSAIGSAEGEHFLCDDWFDPLETGVRTRIRSFIEELLEAELDAALGRDRYERPRMGSDNAPKGVTGSRHGHRGRGLLGTFGATTVRVPRARLATPEGKTTEWRNATIPAYQRRTKQADALIAGAYLSGTNTRRVRRALAALFGGAVGKDTVSRVWRKTKGDWDVWNARSLADEPIIRLILDGTVVRVRLDKKATSISLLVALGVRSDGQKVLLAIKNMGGESEAAWRALLDNLVARGLKTPELVIVDGGYAKTKQEIEARRKAFIRKWRLKCRAVADSLEEAEDRLFTFARFPESQWKSIRTTNAIERLHEEFKRRIKTQTVLPSADTAAMLFWALLASGQINMRKVDGWQTLPTKPVDQPIDLAA